MSLDKKTWEPTTKTQALSKFLYRAPEPLYVIPVILVCSLLFGLLIQFGAEGLTYGFLIIALPAFLSAWTSTLFVEAFGGKFYFRRSFLTSLVGVLILGFTLLTGLLIRPMVDVSWRYLVIYGYSLLLSMRYLVLRSTCLNYNRYSFIISSAQTFFAFIIHLLLSFNDLGYLEENNFLSLQESLFGIFSSLCIFISSLLFIEIVNAPLKTDVGISGTDLLGFFLSYMIEGTKEVETLFIPLQESFNIPLSIMAVQKVEAETQVGQQAGQSGEITDKTPSKPFHALIISPSVHPGPVGTIGGGDLPSKLAKPLKDLADHILVPHGLATNDNNPSTTGECDKVVRAVRELATSLTEEEFMGKASEVLSRQEDTTIHLVRFGNSGLLISEPVPHPTDDVALEMFKTLSWTSKYHGFEDLMIIDAHNNSVHGGSPVHVGDRISIEMESMFDELCQEEVDMETFSMGLGSAVPEAEIDGLGPKGVETIVMSTHGKTSAFILFDSNNMIGEVRQRLSMEAEKRVDRAFILTADNHVVNATLGGYNPLGLHTGAEDYIPLLQKSMDSALRDLGESRVAIRSGLIEGMNILGFGNTNRLVATINSTIAILKRAAIPCTLLAITSSALMYYII
jgi:putative membrane protein